jgi:hypothetical protein
MSQLETVPHGYITVIKLQNMNVTRNIDFSRIIVPNQASYTLDGIYRISNFYIKVINFIFLRESVTFKSFKWSR